MTVVTREKVVAWVRSQDPRTTYNPENILDCLLARYLKAAGIATAPVCGSETWWDHSSIARPSNEIPRDLQNLLVPDEPPQMYTYAEFLQRADKVA